MPSSRAQLKITEAMPRLASAYRRGVLVPFTGSGISSGGEACSDWKTMIAQLESAAGIDVGMETDAPALARRAEAAARRLRLQGARSFHAAVRSALYSTGHLEPTPAALSLRDIWWPLVITTNYDDLYVNAKESGKPWVVGRSAEDCQIVLRSLSRPSPPLLWALQGFLPHMVPAATNGLEAQLVLGREDYHQAMFRDVHFRRAFAQIFHRRSLLFLGFGLQEEYFLDLFAESVEFMGPNLEPHYAFMQKGARRDLSFLERRFNIQVVEYEDADHASVVSWLKVLKQAANSSSHVNEWSYYIRAASNGTPTARVTISASPLSKPSNNECVGLNVGLDAQRPYLSEHPVLRQFVEDNWGRWNSLEPKLTKLNTDIPTWHVPHVEKFRNVRAFCAWKDQQTRDPANIAKVTTDALEWAESAGFNTLRMPLVGAGKSKAFQGWMSLAEMVRAFSAWNAAALRNCSLVIHVIDPDVLFELRSGRLDIGDLLETDELRFLAEVLVKDESGRKIIRRKFEYCGPGVTIAELAKDLELGELSWSATVTPHPESGTEHPVANKDQSLRTGGVLSGSTVSFTVEPPTV